MNAKNTTAVSMDPIVFGPMISLIAAMDENYLIGQGGKMPWHLPNDLKNFKKITMGKPVIMGHSTYNSIGKPLPGRRNIVLSRDTSLVIPGCEICTTVSAVFDIVAGAREAMVIGGESVYKIFLPFAHKLYLSFIHAKFGGDHSNKYFPRFDQGDGAGVWREVERSEFTKDATNSHDFSFVVYRRGFLSLS